MITIMRMTFMEIRKKKILMITLLMTLAFLVLYGIALYFSYKNINDLNAMMRFAFTQQIMSLGLYATNFIVAFLAIFTSIGLISSEIENGTLDGILAKPISRRQIVLGKYLGILSLLLLYTMGLFVTIIGLNMILGKGMVHGLTLWSICRTWLIFCLSPLFLSAFGIFLSSRISTMGSGIILIILYFIGMVGGLMENIGALVTQPMAKSILSSLGIFSSLLIPTDAIYRKASSSLASSPFLGGFTLDGLTGGVTTPNMLMMAWIVLYTAWLLYHAVRYFETRDI